MSLKSRSFYSDTAEGTCGNTKRVFDLVHVMDLFTGLNSVWKRAVECRDGIETLKSVRPEFECLTHHK